MAQDFLGYTRYYAQVCAVMRCADGGEVRLTRDEVEAIGADAADVLKNWPQPDRHGGGDDLDGGTIHGFV